MSQDRPVAARVTRRLPAPAEEGFDAWLDPARVRRWMFPAETDELVRVAIDARVGGTYSFVVRRGEDEIEHLGEYLEIDRPGHLAFTWGVADEEGSDRVVVRITPLADGCEVTLTHELHPDWIEFRERTEAAWASMLESLADAVG